LLAGRLIHPSDLSQIYSSTNNWTTPACQGRAVSSPADSTNLRSSRLSGWT